MVSCGPSCAVPPIASCPTVGFVSTGSLGSRGLGYGGVGYGDPGYAGAYGNGSGGSTNSAQLDTLDQVIPQPINQDPPEEIVIRPPPIDVIIRGAILSARDKPVAVRGNTMPMGAAFV